MSPTAGTEPSVLLWEQACLTAGHIPVVTDVPSLPLRLPSKLLITVWLPRHLPARSQYLARARTCWCPWRSYFCFNNKLMHQPSGFCSLVSCGFGERESGWFSPAQPLIPLGDTLPRPLPSCSLCPWALTTLQGSEMDHSPGMDLGLCSALTATSYFR